MKNARTKNILDIAVSPLTTAGSVTAEASQEAIPLVDVRYLTQKNLALFQNPVGVGERRSVSTSAHRIAVLMVQKFPSRG